MIEIRCHSEPDGLVVEIVGDLTTATATVLDACLEAAIDAGMPALILDVHAVRRIDRAVAVTLLDVSERLAAVGGSLTVRNLDACLGAVADIMSSGADHGRGPSPRPGRGEPVLGGLAARDGGLDSSPSSRRKPHSVSG